MKNKLQKIRGILFKYLCILPIKLFLRIIFYPFLIIFGAFRESHTTFVRYTATTLSIVFLVPLWLLAYFIGGFLFLIIVGVIPMTMEVVGHSMEPTFHDSEYQDVIMYPNLITKIKGIQRGDIVVFDSPNPKVPEQKFIKRIIGIPGDSVEIRAGYVVVNGKTLNERYINSLRSTYGNVFLNECKPAQVPTDTYLVLGDNRKRSSDSRAFGFVSVAAIHNIIPNSNQRKLFDRWRNENNSTLNEAEISIVPNSYYQMLNEQRISQKLSRLKPNQKLETAALAMAESIIKNHEINKTWEQYSLPINKAIKNSGYNNITTGGASAVGYYSDEEIMNYWMEFDTKSELMNKDYQDTGIAVANGEVDGCPVQVVIELFGGYIPPNYSAKDIKSWEDLLSSIKNVYPSWDKVRASGGFYENNKDKVNRLLDIMKTRISQIEGIVSTMSSNKWLNGQQLQYANKTDQQLYEEQQSIASYLNKL